MSAFTGVTVDREALIANYATVAEQVAPSGVVAVVKADGYGHGAVEVARALVDAGVVASVDDAFATLLNHRSPYYVAKADTDVREGIALIREYDDIVPGDLRRWLNYVGLTRAEFDAVADSFRDPRVWVRNEYGQWIKDNIWDHN